MAVWLYSLLSFLICFGKHYIEIIVRANNTVLLQVLSIGKVYSIKSLLLLSKCHLSPNSPANIDKESLAFQRVTKSEWISLCIFSTFIAPIKTSLCVVN